MDKTEKGLVGLVLGVAAPAMLIGSVTASTSAVAYKATFLYVNIIHTILKVLQKMLCWIQYTLQLCME